MPLSITHSRFRKVLAVFQQLSSVLCWSPLAAVLNPFNQDSYNNFWSLQMATWLSTMEDVFIDSQRLIYIKSAFPPCLKSLVLCLLNSRVELWWVCFAIYLFINLFLLSYIISRHVTHYSLDASKWKSNKLVWLSWFLYVCVWN